MTSLDDIQFDKSFSAFVLDLFKHIHTEIKRDFPEVDPPDPHVSTNRFLTALEKACLVDLDQYNQLSSWFYRGEMDKAQLELTKITAEHIIKFLPPPFIYDPLTLHYLFKSILTDSSKALTYVLKVKELDKAIYGDRDDG